MLRSYAGLRSLVLWGVSLAFLLLVAFPACASIVQLTSDATRGSQSASISADGSVIAFESNADLTGGNSDHSDEIFVINSDGSGVLQLTSGTDPVNEYSWGPSISGDGSLVVFVSILDPTGGNAVGTNEIFLAKSDGSQIKQLTADPTFSSDMPAISADGSKVVFVSNAQWLGGNTDGSTDIWVINSDGTGLKQLIDAPWGTDSCCWPDISADGSTIVFQSNGILIGSQNLDKSFEIFAVNSAGAPIPVQLTDQNLAAYDCCMPKISGDGSKVTFASDADLTGANSDHSEEIFVINSDKTGLTQLTADSNVVNSSDDPSINADGSVIVFESDADLTGANPDFSDEIFMVNSDGTALQQLTSASPASIDSQNPSISADGSKVAFDSEADLTGGNADNNEEVFVACLGSVEQGINWTPWIALEYRVPVTPTDGPFATSFSQATFTDVDPDHPFWGYIEELAAACTEAISNGIVGGYGDGSYQPTWAVNRAAMAVFISRAVGIAAAAEEDVFDDVPASYWSADEIQACVDAGIVAGFPDGLYRPTMTVTRAQMCVFVVNARGETSSPYEADFEDVGDRYWARGYIQTCLDDFIVQGYPDNFFRPDKVCNRGEMAVFIWRALVGDVVLGGPAATNDNWLSPLGPGLAKLFLPTVVTTTGANTIDVGPDTVVYIVLDAVQIGDGSIVFDLDDSAGDVDSETLVVDAGDSETAVNAAGGVPYLIAAYQIESGLPDDDYTLTITLPNGNVQTMEFTVE